MQVVNTELQQFFLISKPGRPLQQMIDRLTCISWCWSKVHLSPATRLLLDKTKPITITDTIASHLAILLLSVVPQCMLSPWFNWSRGETMSERSGDGDSDATSQYLPSHVNWAILQKWTVGSGIVWDGILDLRAVAQDAHRSACGGRLQRERGRSSLLGEDRLHNV